MQIEEIKKYANDEIEKIKHNIGAQYEVDILEASKIFNDKDIKIEK